MFAVARVPGLEGRVVAVALVLLFAFSACSSGADEKELASVRQDLQTEKALTQSLEAQRTLEKDKAAALQVKLDQTEAPMAELESVRAKTKSMESRMTDEMSAAAALQAQLVQAKAQIAELEDEYLRASSLLSDVGQLRETVDKAEAQQALLEALLAWNMKDAKGFAAGFTEKGLAETMMGPPNSIGEPAIALRRLIDTTVTGDSASIHAMYALGTHRRSINIFLVRDDGVWKIDDDKQLSPKIKGDTISVEVQLENCSFQLDPNAVTGGNVAFILKNVGQQDHGLVLTKVPEDLNLTDLVPGVGLPPVGIQDVAFVAELAPEDEINVAFTRPLMSGRYVFRCPAQDDAEGLPPITKDMLAEFTVP